ncbi:solute carrier family 26 protein [Flavobacteriaceae bacterium F08102]|nr:solute carrier family 26 protein [Flavobacteriaceae bacterium F08102]
MKNIIPILSWLPSYNSSFLKGDILAGFTVGIILIPQGIAYAIIAELPPIYGLYTALIPLIVYTIFGTSRRLAVGPVAIDSLIIAASVSTLAKVGTEHYISIVLALTMMVGIIQIIVGVFRLGFIVNFLSKPVLTGFVTAAALIIGLNQFKSLLRIDIERNNKIQYLIADIIEKFSTIHLKSLLLGGCAILIIYSLKKVHRRFPGALVVVILGIVIMKFFETYFEGVQIVRDIPKGLPQFAIPEINWALIKQLIPIALTLSFTGFLQAISIAKSFVEEDDAPVLDSNRELIALGLSNIMGSFSSTYTSSGSFARSAINKEMGAQSPMANVFAAIFILLTLFFLTPVFYYLPKSVLAAIIIVAIFGLIKIKDIQFLYKTNKKDFIMMLVTFIVTMTIGVKEGILIGVLVSIFVVIFETTRPHMAVLGKVPGTSHFYRNKRRFSDVILHDEILIVRFDAQLYFANTNFFKERLADFVKAKGPKLKVIIIDAEVISNIDSSGIAMFQELVTHYKNKNIQMYFTSIKGPVRDAMTKSRLIDTIGKENFFMSIQEGVDHFEKGETGGYDKYIHQANVN